jgi:putative protease
MQSYFFKDLSNKGVKAVKKKTKKKVKSAKKVVRKKKVAKKSARRVVKKKKTVKAKKPKQQIVKSAVPQRPLPPKGAKKIGRVSHYFDHIQVGALTLQKPLKTGNRILFLGTRTNFEQAVGSMQIEHQPVSSAKAGDEIGLKVDSPVREKDDVYLV